MRKKTLIKLIEVFSTLLGVLIFFIICWAIGLTAEQTGRAFAWITIPLIAYLIGLEYWKKKKLKEKENG